jgi:AcrR family transcriptional regulator
MTSTRGSTRQPAAARRRAREREILRATRQLFDENGVRDAQIEDIARAVGVNRAIIYRHFSGKEELFALTLVSYLEDLETRLTAASKSKRTPLARLVAVTEEFIDFGVEYPAFVDCAQTLMRRPGPELLEEISESALFRLGRGISACLSQLSGLGALQLARVGMLVKESAPGIPAIAPVSALEVRKYVVATAVALASAS